jgi:hypothetical protein
MTEPTGARLHACDAVVDWCLRNAARREAAGEAEQSGIWCYAAALTASQCGHSWLCAAPLERQLLRLAARLAHPPRAQPVGATPRRWLHVLTYTTRIGGHTALARRWIARNPDGDVHDLVVTAQAGDAVDPALVAAARATGGSLHSLSATRGMLARAAALRALAYARADVVVLHVHPWDVLPSLAFGVPGGPPVALMNHADHAFWVGVAAADTVIDFRDSGAALSAALRRPRAASKLPLPLDDTPVPPRDRAALAARLGDPAALGQRRVLLTVGRAAKYQSRRGLDFFATMARILAAREEWVIVAVGPSVTEPSWQALHAATGGRAFAVGEQADLAPWYGGADLYAEGFPVGSYTALLETALAGHPFVRKPPAAPPDVLPIDRGALDSFPPPMTPLAYADAVITLMMDAPAREHGGARARDAVRAVHVTGWNARLADLRDALPAQHEAALAHEPAQLPSALLDYVAGAWSVHERQSPLDVAREALQQQGISPRTDIAVLDAVRAWRTAAD